MHSNEHTSNYFDGILSSGFLPAIMLPTRISTNNSLIDNIFVNKQGITNFSAILEDEISDLQVIAININLISPENKTNTLQYRQTVRNASQISNMTLDPKYFW